MKKVTISVFAMLMIGCTSNTDVHNYGGSEDVTLPAGQHFVDAYWDSGDHLWYVTRPMVATDQPTVYTMHEKSNFGSMQGTVVFRESR